MFDKIQHIGYLVADLDAAVAWFNQSFGGEKAGGADLRDSVAVPGGGRNAFVRFGRVEMELIEPSDRSRLPAKTLVMHHVGYVVSDIDAAISDLKGRGFQFAAPAPTTNVMGQRLLYFDPATTNGCLMHLTQLPARPDTVGVGRGLAVEKIVHAGYLVADLEEATDWYVKKLDGVHIGGGQASRAGFRIAFVDFGRVQVELIEPQDRGLLGSKRQVMHHVGYVVGDLGTAIAECRGRGFRFEREAPSTNPVGYQVLYFDAATTMGSPMHLTRLPSD